MLFQAHKYIQFHFLKSANSQTLYLVSKTWTDLPFCSVYDNLVSSIFGVSVNHRLSGVDTDSFENALKRRHSVFL